MTIKFKKKDPGRLFREQRYAWRAQELLATIRVKFPDLRLGQIIYNSCQGQDIFYITDEVLAAGLAQFLEDMEERERQLKKQEELKRQMEQQIKEQMEESVFVEFQAYLDTFKDGDNLKFDNSLEVLPESLG